MMCRVLRSSFTARLHRMQAVRPIGLVLLAMGVVVAGTGRVEAAIITYSFSGTLNAAYANVSGPGPATHLPGVISGVGNGQAYTGTFSFDDQAPFLANPQGDDSIFTWTSGTITIDIGGYDYSFIRYGGPGGGETVTLIGGIPSYPDDLLSFNGQAGGPVLSGKDFSQVSLGVIGQPGFLSSLTTLAGLQLDPSLLLSGPEESGVDLTEIFPNNPGASFDIDAAITAISPEEPTPAVPEPLTLAMFGQAALLIGGGAWRTHQRRVV